MAVRATDGVLSAQASLDRHVRLKLAALGTPLKDEADDPFMELTRTLLDSYREKCRLLADHLPAPDGRIQAFLDHYLGTQSIEVPRLPGDTFILDRPGLADHLALPPGAPHYANPWLDSYRVRNGVLHNPRNDRRTTAGSFHIAEGGLPIPGDKKAVPAATFARLLESALTPPGELLQLPYTVGLDDAPSLFVSLLMRPLVVPEIPGSAPEKRMEIRFFAPAALVANLDFVERIFGNAGDPYLARNDAGLDTEGWSGHTGCIILAPHLISLSKRALGLPHWDAATERQRAEGMCWRQEDEPYNEGRPFKITARDAGGVIVTLLGDNYFGYSKKEVKTQIGYAANLYGNAEEEHAGGALVMVRRNHGEDFGTDTRTRNTEYRFADVLRRYGERLELQPEGHAVDREWPRLIYVPETDLKADIRTQRVSWTQDGCTHSIPLEPERIYMHPSGYRVHLEKHPTAPSWRLIGTEAEGILIHKPYTVSGGGKSEIAKSIEDTVIYAPIYVADFESDLAQVQAVFDHDYSQCLLPELREADRGRCRRPLLSGERSLGSVIRLLTPSSETYTDEYNAWLETIPDHIRALVFLIKRFYKPEWGVDWRSHFSVDMVNGRPGNELKFEGRKLQLSYLRVGFQGDGAWRIYKLRQDFYPAQKLQREDDITASTTVTVDRLPNRPRGNWFPAAKLVVNCESRLFQRPDDAIHRGHDTRTERDLAGPDNFMSNYQPLDLEALTALIQDAIGFVEYSEPMQRHLRRAYEARDPYTVAPSHPRLVEGRPSKNPRYLQQRDDLADPFPGFVAEMSARLHRRLPADAPLVRPVDAILMGRRNNPPEPGIRPLAVYNPVHYQELPELFMDLIASVTGKSPSTTGAGSEGALTKGPFNALRTTADLNNAFVGLALSGYAVFSTAAGHVGAERRVEHDISLLVPEVWARLPSAYRDPARLIAEGLLEAVTDFEWQGRTIAASRLGYRITPRFVHRFFGRVFDSPGLVFDEAILRPETQDMAAFVDGMDNIVEAQQRMARQYLEDGSIEEACPPLQVLLTIMAEGQWEGKDVHDPQVRALFTREAILESDWYRHRLTAQQARETALWERMIHNLRGFLGKQTHADEAGRLELRARLARAQSQLDRVTRPDYPERLFGSPGADPLGPHSA